MRKGDLTPFSKRLRSFYLSESVSIDGSGSTTTLPNKAHVGWTWILKRLSIIFVAEKFCSFILNEHSLIVSGQLSAIVNW